MFSLMTMRNKNLIACTSARISTAILMALTIAFSPMGRAQTNTSSAPPPPPPPPPKWQTSATLGATVTEGNTRTILVTGNFQTQRKSQFNEFLAGGDGAYGKDTTGTNDIKSAESLHGFSQYNRLATDRLYYGLHLDALHDAVAGINYRFTAAPLVGYYFIKATNTTLSTEIGPGFVYQRNTGQDPDSFATLRLGERFEHKFNPNVRLYQDVEILPQVDRFGNYYVNAEIGLDSTLSKHVAWTTYLQDSYYNEPTPGRLKNDLKIVSGIKYTF